MSAAKKVPVVNVTVGATTYPAGELLPEGVAELISNPKVWEKAPEPEVPEGIEESEDEPAADPGEDAAVSEEPAKTSRARK